MQIANWLTSLSLLLGAPALADEPLNEPAITDSDREHWSFRRLGRAEVPAVKNPDWCRSPIDRFILAKLEQAGLEPMPEAARETLVRRVTFDLTGLPPDPDDIEGFVTDDRPEAWERLIDRLLSSSAYGERWAQHWLDLARFAETDGFEHDLERPNAWRYRDWVIEALNRDLPYDEFLRLQLAGDEIQPGDPAALIATGFLLSGPDMPDLNDQNERRHVLLNDMTATLGSVVMGLQLGCAQCHDHKFDPLSQADFYRLRAFFEPAEFFREHPLSPADPKATARTLLESSAKEPESRLMVRGDHRRPGPVLSPGFVRVVSRPDDALRAAEPDKPTTGRRSQLAAWLTRPDHPLTARVLVNRVWQQHFGRGIVETTSDFGIMGDSPTHPELLDWLASTFVAPLEQGGCGWSLKRLHRLILTSAVWKQSSHPAGPQDERWQAAKKLDPANRLWSRMASVRLDGEQIRDALLAASGRLSARRGGPGVRPPLPAELVGALLNKNHWVVSPDPVDHHRRSVYLFARRNLRYPLFEAFDRPDANASCARRTRSTIAPQALFLLNSELSLQAANDLADLARKATSEKERINLIWQRAMGRVPGDAECQSAREFLNGGEELADLCLAIFNANEFVYVD